ncbi:hypothetical protein MHOL44478_07405 [Mycobacterium holsaticum DSM 44478]|nr:hypothetical protein [Mycolicibacterium holsaticum DSM 44478 = JCM 12374]
MVPVSRPNSLTRPWVSSLPAESTTQTIVS